MYFQRQKYPKQGQMVTWCFLKIRINKTKKQLDWQSIDHVNDTYNFVAETCYKQKYMQSMKARKKKWENSQY